MFYTISIFLILFTYSIVSHDTCLNLISLPRNFYRIKKCYKSTSHVFKTSNTDDLKTCMKLARQKNALAFNFSPPHAKRNLSDENFVACQLLSCPDTTNLTALVNDTAFDYYSAYGNSSDTMGAQCHKYKSLYKLVLKKQNYSTAIENCQEMGADLANILTSSRTNFISTLLAATITDWYKGAFIGLDDIIQEGHYENPLGESISCYKYRAWSPGHPRNIKKSDDCVIIDSFKSWRIVNCKSKLPYVCEFFNQGPEKHKQIDYSDVEDCDDLDDLDQKEECIQFKKRKKKKKRDRCLVDD